MLGPSQLIWIFSPSLSDSLSQVLVEFFVQWIKSMVNLWLIIGITIYLVGGDWKMAGLSWLSICWEWNVIIPTDVRSMIFQRGRYTTNKVYRCIVLSNGTKKQYYPYINHINHSTNRYFVCLVRAFLMSEAVEATCRRSKGRPAASA